MVSVLLIGCGSKSSTSEVPASTASTAMITVSQVPTTVATGGTQIITPTGGTPPYTFTLSDTSVGTVYPTQGTSTTFTANATATYATVIVTDSLGVVNYFPIVFSTTSTGTTTTTTACAGNYNVSVNGTIGTMSILTNSTGAFLGNLTINGGVAAIQGTCTSSGTISFLNQYSGSQYSGTFGLSGTQMMMTGTFLTITGGTYPWSAVGI